MLTLVVAKIILCLQRRTLNFETLAHFKVFLNSFGNTTQGLGQREVTDQKPSPVEDGFSDHTTEQLGHSLAIPT